MGRSGNEMHSPTATNPSESNGGLQQEWAAIAGKEQSIRIARPRGIGRQSGNSEFWATHLWWDLLDPSSIPRHYGVTAACGISLSSFSSSHSADGISTAARRMFSSSSETEPAPGMTDTTVG